MAAVYALIDPRTHQPRYIGKALNVRLRYRNHFKQCKWERSRKSAWMRELRAAGMRPDLIVIEECSPADSAAREKYWIKRALWRDIPLLNMKSGGQGRLATSEETRRRISEGNKGKGHGPEWSVNHSASIRGKKHSEETKAKMGKQRAGNQRARKWNYTVIFPDGRHEEIENVAVFCKEHGFTAQQIWNFAAYKVQTQSGLRFARIERRSALKFKGALR